MNRAHEMNYLVNVLNKIFLLENPICFDIDKINWEAVLILSKYNNILFAVAVYILEHNIDDLPLNTKENIQGIVHRGLRKLSEQNIALLFLQRELSQDFLLLKTYRKHQRIPNDLDFLVEDFDAALIALDKLCGKGKSLDLKTKECLYLRKNKIKLHLHGRVGWLGKEYMDYSDIFKDTRVEDFNGMNVKIPNYSIDFLIHLAHMNFEPLHFTISELAYLYSIRNEVDMDYCQFQAKKHHWGYSFRRTKIILRQFEKYFFERSVPIAKFDTYYTLPKTFSRYHIVASFLEKGIVLEPLKKISKVMKILFSGDSYDGFYQAPEENIAREK